MSTHIDVVVTGLRAVARDVLAIELQHKAGTPLPGAAPGAHIDLALPNGLVRQYSLVNAGGQAQQAEYVIAVGWDVNSRGGSLWVHEKLRVGQTLKVSPPRNLFAMDPHHRKVLLVAGGIGVTPIYAMAQHCAALGLDWEVLACARSCARLAYLEELKALAGPRLRTHFDDEHGGPVPLAPMLKDPRWDGLYACGPAPMLDALLEATDHWPPGSVHLERFKAADTSTVERQPFELVLSRSGLQTTVSTHESMLDAMERMGVDHPFACREGLCGSCEAPILEGQALHLDSVLTPQECAEQQRVMVCVSRCAGARLVLDL